MIITKYLDTVKKQLCNYTGTTVTQISVDYTEEHFQVWATLYDSTNKCDYMVEYEIETLNLTQFSDHYIMNAIVTGLVSDYLISLSDTSTRH